MSPHFRYSLVLAGALAALATIAFACSSGTGGNLGDPCQSASDCQDQFECLPFADGGCTKGGDASTCQQACTSMCEILGTNYTCTPLECAGPGNSGICTTN
jgi:hypothetical protein